jgi:hypothetical protein
MWACSSPATSSSTDSSPADSAPGDTSHAGDATDSAPGDSRPADAGTDSNIGNVTDSAPGDSRAADATADAITADSTPADAGSFACVGTSNTVTCAAATHYCQINVAGTAPADGGAATSTASCVPLPTCTIPNDICGCLATLVLNDSDTVGSVDCSQDSYNYTLTITGS